MIWSEVSGGGGDGGGVVVLLCVVVCECESKQKSIISIITLILDFTHSQQLSPHKQYIII